MAVIFFDNLSSNDPYLTVTDSEKICGAKKFFLGKLELVEPWPESQKNFGFTVLSVAGTTCTLFVASAVSSTRRTDGEMD